MSEASSNSVIRVLTGAAARLMRPLARVFLRYGLTYAAFADVAKRVYVDVARREFTIPGRKQSMSRISALTGLSRKEVARVWQSLDEEPDEGREHYNRAAQVMSGWRRDDDFIDSRGRPAALSVDGPEPSFATLVRRYGSDVPARAIYDELERVGAIKVLKDGRVRLEARALILSDREVDTLEGLGVDVADLVSSVDHNLQSDPAERVFQRKVAYDNLPAEARRRLREVAWRHGQTLLERLDREMAKYDRDVAPKAKGGGRHRAVLGVYYFDEDLDERHDDRKNHDDEKN